jgi:hypothetical protein
MPPAGGRSEERAQAARRGTGAPVNTVLPASKQATVQLFDAPGKATFWGMAGCIVCSANPGGGVRFTLIVTLVTALIGCFNP